MGRTIGAAIGAIIVFLFFVLGVQHSKTPETQQAPEISARAAAEPASDNTPDNTSARRFPEHFMILSPMDFRVKD